MVVCRLFVIILCVVEFSGCVLRLCLLIFDCVIVNSSNHLLYLVCVVYY